MEFPIKKLLKHCDSFEPLIWWENLFGKAFSAIRPFLAPCEDRRGDFYPSPDNPSVQLTIRDSGRRYRAFPPDELKEKIDDVLLDWDDVQAHHFDCDRLRTSLRKTFNFKPAASRPIEGLFYIGRCERNREHRHVYACLAVSDQKALQAAENCTDPKKTGCVLFPAHHTKAADLLKSRGIASVALRECLSIKPDGFHGECPKTCQACKPISSTELSSQIESLRRDKTESLRVKQIHQKVIEDMADGPDQFLAGLRAKLSEKETVLFMALIYKEADSFGQRQVHSYAEMGKRLGKISKQAIEGRVRRFEKKHPKAWTYVEAIRHPKSPVPFSGLSPSERRKQGIEESYNYDSHSRH